MISEQEIRKTIASLEKKTSRLHYKLLADEDDQLQCAAYLKALRWVVSNKEGVK